MARGSSLGFRLAGVAPWLVAALIIAGLVHIIAILAMPHLATRNSHARIAAVAAVNRLQIIDNAPGPSQIPYEDPATAMAVCRFDLAKGPLRLRGNLAGDDLVLISFRDGLGRTFFSMTDRGASRGQLDVVLATPAQLEELEAADEEDATPSELRLPSRSQTGFIVLRALAAEPGALAGAREKLQAIDCSPMQQAAK